MGEPPERGRRPGGRAVRLVARGDHPLSPGWHGVTLGHARSFFEAPRKVVTKASRSLRVKTLRSLRGSFPVIQGAIAAPLHVFSSSYSLPTAHTATAGIG